jgi:hypothetical protein
MRRRLNLPARAVIYGSVLSLCLSMSGCVDNANTAKPVVKDGQPCGVTEGAFRSRWWNYYERGQSFAACGMWPEAEKDLRQALSLRSQDQRRARTYGMHFVDYFGHRELGVALYGQGRLEEAIKELQTSLASVKSAKAEVYLDRARKLLIEKNQWDRLPPNIEIETPRENALVQGFSIKIQGTVRDDTYVKQISVNGIPVRIDLGAERIRFDVDVPLARLANRIEVTAKDITGRTSTAYVIVESDREGPVLGIEAAEPGKRLKGYIDDPSGLAEVNINGQPVPVPQNGMLPLDQTLPPALAQSKLLIEAIDRAGNFTTAELDFTERLNGLPNRERRLAASKPVRGVLSGLGDELRLNYRSSDQAIYLDQLYLQGSVSMPAGLVSLKVDEVELLRRPGKTVFFTHRASLQPGKNSFRIKATDANGRVMQQDLALTRQLKQLDRRSARYRLALLGQSGVTRTALSPVWRAIAQQQRFQPAGNAPMTLDRSPDDARISSREAAEMGKKAADAVFLTFVKQASGSLEYIGQLVDTHSGQEVLLVDAYQDDKRSPETLATSLLKKLSDQLPLAQGRVASLASERVGVQLTEGQKVPAGMPLWIYREQTPRQDPVTGAPFGADHEVLGLARLDDAKGAHRQAVPLDKATIKRLKVNDRIRSR